MTSAMGHHMEAQPYKVLRSFGSSTYSSARSQTWLPTRWHTVRVAGSSSAARDRQDLAPRVRACHWLVRLRASPHRMPMQALVIVRNCQHIRTLYRDIYERPRIQASAPRSRTVAWEGVTEPWQQHIYIATGVSINLIVAILVSSSLPLEDCCCGVKLLLIECVSHIPGIAVESSALT